MAEIKALSSEIPIPLNSINSELNAFPSIPSPTARVVSMVTIYLVGAVAVISLVKILISPEIINLEKRFIIMFLFSGFFCKFVSHNLI